MSKFLLGSIATYLGFSYTFQLYPSLLHPPKPELVKRNTNFKKWIIAHRGGSLERPENTIEAFRHAYNLNCDMLEMDVIPTKDNVIAVSHENSLKRLCGVNQLITETDFKDLPVYLPTFFTHFLNESVSFEGKKYRIPALEQVFRELPDIYICIEIKEPTDFAIREVKRLIDKYDRQNITVKIT